MEAFRQLSDSKATNKEDELADKKCKGRCWEIRVFYMAFGLICLANLAYYGHGLLTFPGAMRLISEEKPLAASIIVSRTAWFLTIGALVWLLVHTYRLIRSISKEESFKYGNPRRVRNIAYGALFLASVGLLDTVLNYLLMPAAQLKLLLYNLMGLPMWAAFFGLALLIIARAFEEGLRLKETEKFTI
jgi:hypothetical protein